MEILCGIEPEVISLFSSNGSAPIPIDIGLDSPLPPPYVPQELEVQFIMGLLKYITIRHLQQWKKKKKKE